MEQRRDRGAMDLHGALGAKLLTAEATDAIAFSDLCLLILNGDRLGGADITAYAAADAEILFELGACAEELARQRAEKPLDGILAVARKA